jgi:hypothetical protein
VLRRPVVTVPNWWTSPDPGAVKVVTIAEPVESGRVEASRSTAGAAAVDDVVVVAGEVLVGVVFEPLLLGGTTAAVGVTAFDAAEVTELATGDVVLTTAVKV